MTVADEFRVILRERAARLSRPLDELPKDLTRVVIFNVGRELYGMEIVHVLEICRPESVTYVPGAESYIEGVTNLRGEIVAVADLKSLLTGEPRNKKEKRGGMILAEIMGKKLGMLVTGIDGIYDIQSGSIDPPLNTLEKLKAEHLVGEFMFRDRIVGLLNAVAVLGIKGT